MTKRERDKDAALWTKPEMQNLDAILNEVLKVPKTELDKRLAEDDRRRAAKRKPA